MTQAKQLNNYTELSRFHRQTYRNNKLNRHCEHVIRNGEAVMLTPEQVEQFLQNICDIQDNPIHLHVFLGMATYVCIAGMLPLFMFAMASGSNQVDGRIARLFYMVAVILLFLVLAGFVGLCIRITRKNRKHADRFRAEAREKIMRGNYRAYAYRIEEIFRIQSYNEDMYGGYLYFWYRVCDVIFELPNTTFAYDLNHQKTAIYREPEKLEINEHNHPVGGYIFGILIYLDGHERFYGI